MRSSSNISLRLNPEGDWPQVDPSAYIDPTAQLIGNVHIGPRVYVGPNAVVRADETDTSLGVAPIEIGPECNVQDGVIVHALGGTTVTVGRRSSLGHGCIVHGPCTLGEGCFVGFGAKVFDAAIGDGVFVGTGAVVQGVELAPESLVPPAVLVSCREHVIRLVGTTSPEDRRFVERVVAANVALVEGYIRLNG
ncbi:MAG: carbonate dehydratase [Phycisphaerae bacterium]|nr:carbonate dehydratase [Phycisphaerae bacterium]